MVSDDRERGHLAVAVAQAREARKAGKLREALESLDRAVACLIPGDSSGEQGVATEGTKLGKALDARGAPLAALSEHLRALDLAPENPDAREGIRRGVTRYDEWRPKTDAIAPKDQLKVGATGAFWAGRSTKARVVVFEGGIRTETVDAARRALELATQGVSWVLLDMKDLLYIGSTGLAAAVKSAEQLAEGGGGLAVFSLASNLAVVIDTLGLGRFLQVVPTLEHALARPSAAARALKRR
ncbi:STAS domain-containing protein [bacterium]|nr:STAS domain-containing protein [bacterium]